MIGTQDSKSRTWSSVHGNSAYSESAVSDLIRSLDESHTILSVLYVAQQYDVDIVPTTWEVALPTIGQGGTASVHQSNLNLQTSFAFKRLSDYRMKTRKSTDNYKNLIAELRILSMPAIRSHPHIITVEGFTWDILDGDVWPVILFEKGGLGNLEEFARSEAARSLPILRRLEICYKIADAVETVHAQGNQRPMCRVF